MIDVLKGGRRLGGHFCFVGVIRIGIVRVRIRWILFVRPAQMIAVLQRGNIHVVDRQFDFAVFGRLACVISVVSFGRFEFSGDSRIHAQVMVWLKQALRLARHHSVFETFQIQQDGPFGFLHERNTSLYRSKTLDEVPYGSGCCSWVQPTRPPILPDPSAGNKEIFMKIRKIPILRPGAAN